MGRNKLTPQEIALKKVVSSNLNNGDEVRLYGYHGDLNARLAYGPGEVTAVETFKFRHNCDAIAGSSGGPVTTNWSTVAGIHHGGYYTSWKGL